MTQTQGANGVRACALARRFEAAPIRTATLARGGSRPTQRAAGSWLCGSQFPERASCIGSDTSMLAPATTSTTVTARLKRLVRTRGIAADDATLLHIIASMSAHSRNPRIVVPHPWWDETGDAHGICVDICLPLARGLERGARVVHGGATERPKTDD